MDDLLQASQPVDPDTIEAEVVALHDGVTKQGIPGLVLWEQLKGKHQTITVAEDNQAAVRIIISGKNPNMRYLSRTQRVDIARLNQFYSNSLFEFIDCPTEFQAANMMTKAISDSREWRRDMCTTGHFTEEVIERHVKGDPAAPASRGVSQNFGDLLSDSILARVDKIDIRGGITKDENGVQVGIMGECMIVCRANEIHEEPRISVADLPWQSTKGLIVIVPPRRSGIPSQQKSRGSREIKPTTEEQGDMDTVARLCEQASRTHKVLVMRPENAFMSHGIMKYVCEDCGFEKPLLVHNVAGLEGGQVANVSSIHMSASRHTVFRPVTHTHTHRESQTYQQGRQQT